MTKVSEKLSLFDLDNEEEDLAVKLRSVCNPPPLNNEKRSKLLESTEILYHLGRVYLKKAAITTNVDQKLNFLKSAALLHGVRVRCQISLKDKVTEKKCLIAIKDLQDLLMKNFIGKLSSSLIELSAKVAHRLQEARSEVKRHLRGLTILKGLRECELENEKGRKILEIRSLSHYCTEFYIRQMSTIATQCLGVCGPPPCEFTLVGFGSLARGQATLYSDFRHGIILEDEAKTKDNYEEILEYFRWFTVLFHVIIIGLGETAISRVGVESLNNFKNESKNWFHDSFTPSAITFDRILFHSYDTSRGAEKPLGEGNRFPSLIKPLGQMVDYLTSEEAFNDRYCVKDVLCDICFVFGSKDLFSKFKILCDSISSENSLETLLKEVEKDQNRPWSILQNPHLLEEYPRNEMYRIISLLIEFAARANKISGRSGFDKALQLGKKLGCESVNSLQWALAVAIEIRLKTYQANFSAKVRHDILKYVGPKCLINCVSMIRILMQFIGIYLPCTAIYDELACVEEKIIQRFFQERCSVGEEELKVFERNGFASEHISKNSSRHRTNAAESFVLLHRTYLPEGFELLESVEKSVLSIKRYRENPFLLFLLSFVYQCQDSHPEEKRAIDSAVTKFEEVGLSYYSDDYDEETIGMEHAEAINYLKSQLEKSSDDNWQKKYIVSLMKEHLGFDEIKGARQLSEKLLAIFQPRRIFTRKEIEFLFMHQVTWLRKRLQRRRERLKIKKEEDFRSDVYEDMRDAQISAAKHIMTATDFMARCSRRVADNSDILLKLHFSLHLVEAKRENGHKNEARRLLRDLVDFCAANGAGVIGIHVWTKVMRIAANIQIVEFWYKDFIKTWETIDDVVDTGRVFSHAIRRHELMAAAAGTYIGLATDADRTFEKVKFIRKSIEICQRSENSVIFQTVYWNAAMLLIDVCEVDRFKEFKVADFHELLSESLKSVSKSVCVGHRLTMMFDSFYKNLLKRKSITPMEICHFVEYSYRIMGEHPTVLHPALHSLSKMAYKRLRTEIKTASTSVPFSDEIRLLWRSLVVSSSDKRKITFIFVAKVYDCISVTAFRRFCSTFLKFENPLSSYSHFHPEIASLLHGSHHTDPVKVNKLWRIVIRERKNSYRRNLSIELLCKTLAMRIEQRVMKELEIPSEKDSFKAIEKTRKLAGTSIAKALGNLYLDDLEFEEIDLARRLREVCNPGGEEKRLKLRECTQILYSIGCVYLKKVVVEEGMSQKMSFIKPATLLHAARVRCQEILNDEKLEQSILNSLHEMQTLLMKKYFRPEPFSLMDLSKACLVKLEKARLKAKHRLSKLRILKKSQNDFDEGIQEKVLEMKEILKYSTEFYLEMMSDIARNCLKVCGPQPCEFTIVGLGSLARGEVTLYSDFEHVIILEDGVQNGADYENILEYFRWFSVLFHVIIIGMGETIIPSIGIESLNDLYSEDKSRNWFYDSFTPSGISFDGMMPHACKIPIGRQRTTRRKHHIVELIKPASQMTEFLTNEEDIINGYHLKDVLSEVCFVVGSEKLFKVFTDLADSILVKRPRNIRAERFSNEIYLMSKLKFPNFTCIDFKSDFYRPLSLLLGYASHKRSVRGKSGFERALQLKTVPECQDYKTIEWAFAVACEIRLKTCESRFSNRPRVTVEVLQYVGAECLSNCVQAIRILMKKAGMDVCFPGVQVALSKLKENLVRYFSLYVKVKPMNFESKLTEETRFFLWAFFMHSPAGTSSHDALAAAEKAVLDHASSWHESPELSLFMSQIYLEQGRNEEAMKAADCAFDNLHAVGLGDGYARSYDQETIGMDHTEIIHYLQKRLSISNKANWQKEYSTRLFNEHLRFGEVSEAKETLTKCLKKLYSENQMAEGNFGENFDENFNRMASLLHPKYALKFDQEAVTAALLYTRVFYDVRANQILIRQHCMERRAFISYCTDSLAKSSDIVSKSLFGKALVENQCKSKSAESRRLLRQLIAFWYQNCMNLMEFWFDWIFDALKIQHRMKWWRDVIETWEMTDDLMGSGKVFFNAEHRLETLFLVVEACIESSVAPGKTSDKVEAIQKAVTICRRPEIFEQFQEHYRLVLLTTEYMGNEDDLKESELSQLYNVLTDSPQDRYDHNIAKSCILGLFLQFLGRLQAQRTMTPEQISSCDKYRQLIMKNPHPFLYPFLSWLHGKANASLYWEGIKLWRCLFSKQAGTQAISKFLDYIENKLTLTVSFNSSSFPTISQDFINGMESYMAREFGSAIRIFWRVINREKKNSFLQRFSVTFLCYCMLHSLSRTFRYSISKDHRKAQLSVIPDEIPWGEIQGKLFTERCIEVKGKVLAMKKKEMIDLFNNVMDDRSSQEKQDGKTIDENTDERANPSTLASLLGDFARWPYHSPMGKRKIRRYVEEKSNKDDADKNFTVNR